MAKDTSKQRLANLIQCLEQTVKISQSLYGDDDVKMWAANLSLIFKDKIADAKQKLNDTFGIDYHSTDAKKQIIKEGSKVKVLVNHMEGMKDSMAIVKDYSIPAMLSDISMEDMEMNNHKWLTNDEVKLM